MNSILSWHIVSRNMIVSNMLGANPFPPLNRNHFADLFANKEYLLDNFFQCTESSSLIISQLLAMPSVLFTTLFCT